MLSFRGRAVTGLCATFAFLLTSYLVVTGISKSFDANYALILNMYAGGSLNDLLVLSSLYGREYVWIPLTAIMLLFGKERTRFLSVELAGIFLAAIVVGLALHHVYFRARPFVALDGIVPRVPLDFGSSFPSGHALIVSTGATFAAVKFRSRVLSFLLMIEAGIVCYSRVYVGMHYPTDVIAGIFLGIALAAFGSIVIEKWLYKIASSFTSLLSKLLRVLRFPEVLEL